MYDGTEINIAIDKIQLSHMSSNNFPKKLADNVTMYSANPIIYVVHDFLSIDECEEFINIAKKIGPEDINTYKVNHDASNLLHETSKRLSILVQTPIRNAEKYLVTTFSKQTIPTETIDSLNPETQSELMKKDSGGQRLLSLLGALAEKNCSEVKSLRDYFQEKIKALSPETIFFGEKANKVANTILMALPKIPGDLALMKLDLESFSVSSGSACSSGKVSKSHVVSAMGYDNLASNSVRFSFPPNDAILDTENLITKEELDRLARCWSNL